MIRFCFTYCELPENFFTVDGHIVASRKRGVQSKQLECVRDRQYEILKVEIKIIILIHNNRVVQIALLSW